MNVTEEERHRRAYTARQLADTAVCSATKAFFLQLEERWHPLAQRQADRADSSQHPSQISAASVRLFVETASSQGAAGERRRQSAARTGGTCHGSGS